jgi:hypothetical protein
MPPFSGPWQPVLPDRIVGVGMLERARSTSSSVRKQNSLANLNCSALNIGRSILRPLWRRIRPVGRGRPFAAALLLPEHSFLQDLYSLSLDGLRSLKPKWKVSVAMMIERLKDLSVINDEQRRKLRINYSVRQWNKAEPFDDEIEVERPMFITRAIRLMVQKELQTVEQISVNSGFSPEWIHRLLSIPPDRLSPDPDPRVIEFKRRA